MPRLASTRAPWLGLATAAALMVAAVIVPWLTGWQVHVRSWPPLHADWAPRVGPGTVPALVVAIGAVRMAGSLSERLPWRLLLLASYGAGLAWLVALALVDGPSGLGRVLDGSYEYLQTARSTHDFGALLHDYIARIPYAAEPDNLPVHLAGHPPGAVGFFVVLARLGLGSWPAAGAVVIAIAASTSLAVLQTLRILGAEDAARRVAPWLVFGPAAIWMAVSADAMFAAVGAWGLAALAAAATSARGRALGFAVISGGLLGLAVMMSYGLPILGVAAVAVLVAARSWRPLVPAALTALVVVLAFAWAGFAWWEALPVLRERYFDGVAGRRPASYWMWANLAAFLFSAGPWTAAALAALWSRRHEAADRVVLLLAGAGALMVTAADLSQMSRAEVERIWLPFVPWTLVAAAALPARWRRVGLIGQVVFALLVQHLLRPDW